MTQRYSDTAIQRWIKLCYKFLPRHLKPRPRLDFVGCWVWRNNIFKITKPNSLLKFVRWSDFYSLKMFTLVQEQPISRKFLNHGGFLCYIFLRVKIYGIKNVRNVRNFYVYKNLLCVEYEFYIKNVCKIFIFHIIAMI